MVSYSASSIKRGDPKPMDTEEMDIASMPKKQKVEQGKQLVQVKKGHAKGHAKKKNLMKE